MNNENYKSDMISERDAEELQSLEYGDHIEPPFWGTSNVLTWSTDTIFQSIKKQDLFKGEWAPGLGNDTIADLEILFTQLKDEVVESDLLQGYGMYGFFPVITEDEQLIIIDPADFHTELMALHFPRLDKLHGRSVCDFFRSSGDSVALQAGTIGKNVQMRCESYLQTFHTCTKGRCLKALAEQCVKIISDKISTEIRRCQGLERGTGMLYDLTGPVLPSSESRKKIFEILSLEERLGIELTEQFEIIPQHSSLGIFVHHPSAVALV